MTVVIFLLFSHTHTDKPGYYEPKLPDPDVADSGPKQPVVDTAHEDVRAGQVVNEQVLPPKHDNDAQDKYEQVRA